MSALENTKSLVTTDIDFTRDGVQTGTLRLPYSHNRSAYGHIPIPLLVAKRGKGPTVLLSGANHGDEYEGPIVITELIRELDPGEIQGRLILMPAINAPAVIAGRRTSPDDGLNLNRSFPGDPHGSMTQQIAAFMADEIYPRGDAFLDLHSGGSSLDLLPSAIIEPTEDAAFHIEISGCIAQHLGIEIWIGKSPLAVTRQFERVIGPMAIRAFHGSAEQRGPHVGPEL